MLAKLLYKNQSAGLSAGNKVTVLHNEQKAIEDIFTSMRHATKSIYLDFYIIESGRMLDEMISVFEERIQSGVNVKLIYDGFGSMELSSSYLNKMRSIDVDIKEFMPFHLIKWLRKLNYRNHRKIIIIDHYIAYTGGMNISDNYLKSESGKQPWKDTIIKIKGPAAQDFEKIFYSDWLNAKGKEFIHKFPKPQKYEDGCTVQVITSGPDSSHKSIMQQYFTIITDAMKYVYITTPYFVPGEAIVIALKTAALSGIDVRIMLPFQSDSQWMKWCMYTYVHELLSSGVRIYLFDNGFQHGKVILSDDIISSIGTANVDERSFETNFEVNAIVYDKATTLELKKHFYEDLDYSEELSLEGFPNHIDRNRMMEPIARLFSPIL